MHDDLNLRAGDTWEIDGVLLDADGNPLDLTDVTGMEWMIRDSYGKPMVDVVTASDISLRDVATAGLVRVTVPNTATGDILPQRCIDFFRVTFADRPHTDWFGVILVGADGWEPPV